jgi:hypothetical protein
VAFFRIKKPTLSKKLPIHYLPAMSSYDTNQAKYQTLLHDILTKSTNFFVLIEESRRRNPCLEKVKLFTDLFRVVEEAQQNPADRQTIVFKLINDLLAFFSSYTRDEVDSIVDKVIKTDEVHPDEIEHDDLSKFKRYIWYFLQSGLHLRKEIEFN